MKFFRRMLPRDKERSGHYIKKPQTVNLMKVLEFLPLLMPRMYM